MSIQDAFNIVLAAAGFLGGFLVKTLWNAVDQLRADLVALQSTLPETYQRRDDHNGAMARIEATLVRIESKLDGKADK